MLICTWNSSFSRNIWLQKYNPTQLLLTQGKRIRKKINRFTLRQLMWFNTYAIYASEYAAMWLSNKTVSPQCKNFYFAITYSDFYVKLEFSIPQNNKISQNQYSYFRVKSTCSTTLFFTSTLCSNSYLFSRNFLQVPNSYSKRECQQVGNTFSIFNSTNITIIWWKNVPKWASCKTLQTNRFWHLEKRK